VIYPVHAVVGSTLSVIQRARVDAGIAQAGIHELTHWTAGA